MLCELSAYQEGRCRDGIMEDDREKKNMNWFLYPSNVCSTTSGSGPGWCKYISSNELWSKHTEQGRKSINCATSADIIKEWESKT